jgi:hypothetical protein
MSYGRLTRQIALFAGGAAIVGMGALTACSSSAKDSPSTTTTTTTVSPSPTEKAVSPGGPNSFSPTVNPNPPGAVCKEIVGNNCIR